MEDATLLLSLVINSKKLTGHLIIDQEIVEWKEKLWPALEQEYNVTDDSSKKVWFAFIKAQFQFLIDRNNDPIKTVSVLIAELNKAVPYFAEAIFFPFSDMSDTLNHIVEVLIKLDIDHPITDELESLARLVDEEVGNRYGQQEASNRLKQRAIQYYEKKRYLQALDAFHQLKHKWTSADSPEGTILAGISIAQCYSRLHMDYASRYYAFGAAQLVAKSDNVELQKYLPKALLIAAEACYASGAWLSYVDLLDLGIISHMVATKDFDLYDESKKNVGIVYHPALILYFTQRFSLTSQNLFIYRFSRWGYIEKEINEMFKEIKLHYDGQTEQVLYESLQEQLNDRVFNDFGPTRTIGFEVYGSRWTISFRNDFDTNAAGEQLVSTIQILMVELHDTELYLLRSEIKIDFSLRDDIAMPKEHVFSSNDKIYWQVDFPTKPKEEFAEDSDVFYSALVVSILREISLLPIDQLMEAIHGKFANQGLVGRLLFVAPYLALYKNFVDENDFVNSARQYFTDQERFKQLKSRSNAKLPWKDITAPAYDYEASLQAIHNRMNQMQSYELTLSKLKKSVSFKQMIQILREKGWLDWQIAICIGNLVVNYKIKQIFPISNPAETLVKAQIFYTKSEKEWYIPIPESLFTIELLEAHLNTTITMAVLPSFGLEFRSKAPNSIATLELLTKRFNYRLDGAEIKVFD